MVFGYLFLAENKQLNCLTWLHSFHNNHNMQDVIPYMAQEYGFEYELITYKWPTWLHKQKEKQRIIWAYKILFLDVIFPLSLEKVLAFLNLYILGLLLNYFFLLVHLGYEMSIWHLPRWYPQVIFVDADQIIRTDMGALYDMDIRGKPLAYTPFCDNNKEMDGYRFWRQVDTNLFPFSFFLLLFLVQTLGKGIVCYLYSQIVCYYDSFLLFFLTSVKQGFWKEHLQGRPYHIRSVTISFTFG